MMCTRRRCIQEKGKKTDVGIERVTKIEKAEPSIEQIDHLRSLQQRFRQLYTDKEELLSMQQFFERKVRSSKRLKLTKDEVEETQMNQSDAISK